MLFTRGELEEIQAGIRPAGALKTVTFDGGITSGKLSTKAAMTTALGGANNDMTYTADTAGTAGNLITVQYRDPGEAGRTIGVHTNGNAIIVDLGTTSTADKAQGTMTSDATNPDATGTFVVGAKTYTFVGALTEAFASKVLTSTNTELADGATVTIGTTVYRFKDTMAQAYDVKRDGTTADTTMGNLIKAINATGTAGVEYFAGTLIHPTVSAGTLTAHAFTATAKTVGTGGNAIALDESSAQLSWAGGAVFLSGGVNSIANEVFIGADAATTLDNVKSAVNASAGAGTTYSSATTANATVDASTNTNTTQLFEAKTAGAAGNAILFSESATHIAVNGSGTLIRGVDAGAIESIASDVKTAIEANTAAAALVDITDYSGNDGSDLVTAMAATPLAGGSDGKVPLFTVTGSVLCSLRGYCGTTLTGSGATLVHGVTGTTNMLIPILTGTNITVGKGIDSTSAVVSRGTALLKVPLWLVQDEDIFATTATHSVDTGKIHYILDYIGLTENAKVVAA